jgi:hypothetical protein
MMIVTIGNLKLSVREFKDCWTNFYIFSACKIQAYWSIACICFVFPIVI